MDYLQRLVAACFLVSGSAHAAYANLSPPPGWTQGGSAAWAVPSNSFASQTANQWINNAAKTSAMLNAGGKQVAINASLALAPSAPRVIAALIFSNPYLRAGVGIASWLSASSVVWDAASNSWKGKQDENIIPSDGSLYRYNLTLPWRESRADACMEAAQFRINYEYPSVIGILLPNGNCEMLHYDANNNMKKRLETGAYGKASSCPAGWYVTPAGCVQTPPMKQLSQEEMLDLLNPANTPGWPMPDTVPLEIPNIPLPVDLPSVNPGTDGNPKPLFIPTGDPVKNPKFNPDLAPSPTNQRWIQPGVNVTPRPTVLYPWRVDVQPVDRPQDGPDPLPDNEQNPDADQNDMPRDEDSKSLCEKHPDILACQKVELGELEPEPLSQNTVTLEINPESGFGPANGTCPSPKQFSIMGKQMAFQWDLLCDFASQIRPLLIGFAYLSAALAFFGLTRKD